MDTCSIEVLLIIMGASQQKRSLTYKQLGKFVTPLNPLILMERLTLTSVRMFMILHPSLPMISPTRSSSAPGLTCLQRTIIMFFQSVPTSPKTARGSIFGNTGHHRILKTSRTSNLCDFLIRHMTFLRSQ